MPIFYKSNIIFIHIPKTGGTSFLKYLENKHKRCNDYTPVSSPHQDHPVMHKTYLQYKWDLKEFIDEYKILTIVRNPYLRILSYYKMHLSASNLKEIEKKYNLKSIEEKFNFYLKKILIEKKLDLIDKATSTCKQTITHLTQTDFLIDEEGIVNKKIIIYRLEKIKNKLAKINRSKINFDFNSCYRCNENIKIVKDYFYKDFINFNYSFELPK